ISCQYVRDELATDKLRYAPMLDTCAFQKAEAIVLKKRDLRETSVLLTLYSREFGKILGVMKGLRAQRIGQYSVSPQVFSVNEIVFYERSKKDIFTVSTCELKEYFSAIREDLKKTVYASYFVELADSLTPQGEDSRQMYDLLLNGITSLAGPYSEKRIARMFEIKLLSLLGVMPILSQCVLCGSPEIEGESWFSMEHGGSVCGKCGPKERALVPMLSGTIRFIEHINRLEWEKVLRIKVSEDVGRQLEDFLQRFLAFHLHIKPKALEFADKVGV
ncbi:MAG: DNA repair protein RecO, partial [Candidatus Omnitrophota bacterium]